MQIASGVAPGQGDKDPTLDHFAQMFRQDGMRLAGTVRIKTDGACEGPCDMDVQVLPGGPVIRISQKLGAHAQGCRSIRTPSKTAIGHVARSLASRPDLLIVNKFGKHEAMGHGFRDVIAESLAQEIPVLVGLNRLKRDDFMAFVGGEAKALAPNVDTLRQWAIGVKTTRSRAA